METDAPLIRGLDFRARSTHFQACMSSLSISPSALDVHPGSAPIPVADRRAETLPWFIVLAALGVTGIPVGVIWDISWHSTIGRDTFWTPAHLFIHAGGLIPGLTCAFLIFRHTFWETPEARASTVRIWGFHGPLGAWVVVWGNLAMLTSAPFDDWWHDAYGLDVQIISPPHSVLALGMFGVALGVLLLVLSWQNRIEGRGQRQASLLFSYVAGILITMLAIMLTEESYPNQHHSGRFYAIMAGAFPVYLAIASRAARASWGATKAAFIYTLIMALSVWLLPLFRAQPMLAPIYNPVTHMVPPAFPLLLLLPAVVFDLVVGRFGKRDPRWWKTLLMSAVLGALFIAALLPAQWHFSKFLLSDSARNALFAGRSFYPYFSRPGPYQTEFWLRNRPKADPGNVAKAVLIGVVASGIGLSIGGWMTRVRR